MCSSHRHARNGAADHVESQVLQRFEADATFTHVELLAVLLVLIRSSPDLLTATLAAFPSMSLLPLAPFTDEPGGESGVTVESRLLPKARRSRVERQRLLRG